jgi:hypothetical protein
MVWKWVELKSKNFIFTSRFQVLFQVKLRKVSVTHTRPISARTASAIPSANKHWPLPPRRQPSLWVPVRPHLLTRPQNCHWHETQPHHHQTKYYITTIIELEIHSLFLSFPHKEPMLFLKGDAGFFFVIYKENK